MPGTQETTTELFASEIIPGHGYKLIERLGRGGAGEIWKVEAPGGFLVALKLIPLDSRLGDREHQSLEVLRAIRHPHLRVTFASWVVDDHLALAMELADRSLWDRFREATAAGLPGIPPDELVRYFGEAAEGIDYLNSYQHQLQGRERVGIQHCDIKPQNLLLFGSGLKVADLGMAQILDRSLDGQAGSWTFAYAPPEFFHGQATRWSDQYSLAVTYYHLRTGSLPFRGTPAAIMAGHLGGDPDLGAVPEAERSVLARALAKDAESRWPTCRALVEALRFVRLGGEAPGPEPAPPALNLPGTDLPWPIDADLGEAAGEPDSGSWSYEAVSAASSSRPASAPWDAAIEAIRPARRHPDADTDDDFGLGAEPDRPRGEAADGPVFPLEAASDGFDPEDSGLAVPVLVDLEREEDETLSLPQVARPRRRTPLRIAAMLALAAGLVSCALLQAPRARWRFGAPSRLSPAATVAGDGGTSAKRVAAGPDRIGVQAPPASDVAGATGDPPPPASDAVAVSAAEARPGADREVPTAEPAGPVPPLEPPSAGPAARDEPVRSADADKGPVPGGEVAEGARPAEAPAPAAAAGSLALQLPDRLTLRAGEPARLPVRVTRQDVAGPIAVRVEGVPAGVRAEPATIPADADRAEVELTSDAHAAGADERLIVLATAGSASARAELALSVAPAPADDPNAKGLEVFRKGRYEDAAAAFGEAIRLHPGMPQALENRATAYLCLGRYDAAIADFDAAIRAHPGNAVAFNNRGLAYRMRMDYPRALADYDEAIRLSPSDARLYLNRAIVLMLMARDAEALTTLSTAIRLNPSYARAYQARSEAYARLGDRTRSESDRARVRELEAPNVRR